MSARNWFYNLALTCAILILGSLAFLANPASAQLLSATANTAPASAREALKSDLGLAYGPKQAFAGQGTKADEKTGATPQDRHDTCWVFVPSPNPSGGAGYTLLRAVSAVSSGDVWAAGNYCINCGTDTETQQTLIEHWNGHAWSVVASPNGGTGDNYLNGVLAFSRSNAWAVGNAWNGTRFESLILHWDGTAWTRTSSPNPGALNNYLYSISGTSQRDIWAVGTYRIPGGPLVVLTEHYDGQAWSAVTGANPGAGRNVLNGVTSLSPNNAWAAGIACDDNPCNTNARGLIEHWDGHEWSVVDSPNPGAGITYYQGISASRPNDIWAVAWYCAEEGAACANVDLVVEHYDGRAWSVVSTHPFAGSEFSAFWGVLAISSKDVWVPGSYSSDGATWINLLRHWDGRSWTDVPVSSPGAYNNDLYAVAATTGNDRSLNEGGGGELWAVGDYDAGIDLPIANPQTQRGDNCH